METYEQQNTYTGNNFLESSMKIYNKLIRETVNNLKSHLGNYSSGAETSSSYALGSKPEDFNLYKFNFGCG